MNKKLLAVAIGTALAGSISIAQADVQLFGQVDVSVDSHDCASGGCPEIGYTVVNSGLNKADGSQKMNMNGNFSYFGIKGTEDLGNGLKAIFNATFAFDVAGGSSSVNQNFFNGNGYGGPFSGNNTLIDSEKWAGVAGDFGSVRAGTVYTPYKEHGEMIDPFYGTSLEGNKGGLQSPFLNNETYASDYAISGLNNRTIRYDSPDMNGLSGGVFYTMGHGTTTPPNGDNRGNPYGLGGQYKNGNILAFGDYLTGSFKNNQFGTSFNDKAWDLGGQYTMGNIAMFGKYERGGLVLMSGESSANMWHLGGSFKMGNSLLYAAYGQGDTKTTPTDIKTKSWTLGVKHNLSVRTSVYAGFNQSKLSPIDERDDHFGLGINVKF